eukprot:scaffold150517_cov19-Prasinocladus_malaysianus.AAC.1
MGCRHAARIRTRTGCEAGLHHPNNAILPEVRPPGLPAPAVAPVKRAVRRLTYPSNPGGKYY